MFAGLTSAKMTSLGNHETIPGCDRWLVLEPSPELQALQDQQLVLLQSEAGVQLSHQGLTDLSMHRMCSPPAPVAAVMHESLSLQSPSEHEILGPCK